MAGIYEANLALGLNRVGTGLRLAEASGLARFRPVPLCALR